MTRKSRAPLVALPVVAAMLGCALDLGAPSPRDGEAQQGQGELRLLLTDAPLDGVESVFVTFSEVRVLRCGASEDGSDTAGKEKEADSDDASTEDSEPRDARDTSADETDGHGEGTHGTDALDTGALDTADDATDTTGGTDTGGVDGTDGGALLRSEEAPEKPVRDRRGSAPADEDPASAEGTDDEATSGEADDDDAATDDVAKTEAASGCAEGRWETVLAEEVTLDLLTLQGGVTAELGLAQLPAGEYGQIRLILSDARIVVGGEEAVLTVPSGSQSGLKLTHGFAIEEGSSLHLTLDFDASRSVHFAPGHGYMLRPVIAIVDESSGPSAKE